MNSMRFFLEIALELHKTPTRAIWLKTRWLEKECSVLKNAG